jgi:hypothetical protein
MAAKKSKGKKPAPKKSAARKSTSSVAVAATSRPVDLWAATLERRKKAGLI